MARHGILYIKSNDGTADAGTLAIYDASGASLITVTATGATSDFSGADAYTYGGNKEFLGFAEVANATEPTYAIGDTFYASGEGTVYIVEAEATASGVTVEYNGSVVATIPSGNKATIPIKDLKMKTDIVITVPSGSGGTVKDSALPIEVSTEAEMTALLTSGEVGGVYKYTGETTDTYENGALYVLEGVEPYSSRIEVDDNGTNTRIDLASYEGQSWSSLNGVTLYAENGKAYTVMINANNEVMLASTSLGAVASDTISGTYTATYTASGGSGN